MVVEASQNDRALITGHIEIHTHKHVFLCTTVINDYLDKRNPHIAKHTHTHKMETRVISSS